MNILKGTIEKVEVSGNLILVQTRVGELIFKSIEIETPESGTYLQVGRSIQIMFKETEVIIAKGEVSPISLQNRIKGIVKSVEAGSLIAKLTLDTPIGEIQSIITSNSVERLQAFPGEEVTALIKTNEIMLGE
ncbi:MAG: TOBE domain-containing protein [Saprospiraceae bacterium]